MTLNFGLSNYCILKAIYILLCRLRKSRNVVETFLARQCILVSLLSTSFQLIYHVPQVTQNR